jgi:hypothetical protein
MVQEPDQLVPILGNRASFELAQFFVEVIGIGDRFHAEIRVQLLAVQNDWHGDIMRHFHLRADRLAENSSLVLVLDGEPDRFGYDRREWSIPRCIRPRAQPQWIARRNKRIVKLPRRWP